jgi:hypothetical protein
MALKPDVLLRHERVVRYVARRAFFAQKWVYTKMAAAPKSGPISENTNKSAEVSCACRGASHRNCDYCPNHVCQRGHAKSNEPIMQHGTMLLGA